MSVFGQECRGSEDCWGKISTDGLKMGQVRDESEKFLIREVWRARI